MEIGRGAAGWYTEAGQGGYLAIGDDATLPAGTVIRALPGGGFRIESPGFKERASPVIVQAPGAVWAQNTCRPPT